MQLKKGGPVSAFTLRKGEILGFAGLVGSGRTETIKLLFGADKADSGQLTLRGKPVRMQITKMPFVPTRYHRL